MAQDIIDAEFETLARSADPAAPADRQHKTSGSTSPDEQVAILKANPAGVAGTRPFPLRMVAIAAAIIAMAFLASRLLSGNPGGDARSFEITDISNGDPAEGGNVVTVSATIRNNSGDERAVPDVLLTFVPASSGRNLVYRIPRGEILKPGRALAFTVRMPKKAGYDEAPRLEFNTHGA